ncbi:MAG TPA: hypothetical protein VN643_05880 [Pyrinomonadaceae bacterium]|nr:hypothetical protein [Pyrinomonadaceae bacterium]
MTHISVGLDFAWQIAAAEAAHLRHQLIEPEHLFIVMCRVGALAPAGDVRNDFPKK